MRKKQVSIPGICFSPFSSFRRVRILTAWSVFAVAIFLGGLANCASAQSWGNPTWSDEFNATTPGTPPDPANWTFDVGSHGWGNNELEVYCAPGSATPAPCNPTHPNAFQDGHGHLVIQALRASSEPAPAGTWTSARLKTRGLKAFQYGRLESCMKLPVGAGLWPAFWMLGTNAKWPLAGEMDIMENVPATGGSGGGLGPGVVESTIHGPSTVPRGLYSLGLDFKFPAGQRIDDASPTCHIYGTIWSPFMVQIYVDDWRKPFFIRTASDVPPGGRWIFNAPFYFILNLAVGGDWPGPPNSTTPSPSEMVVDYVRAYKASPVEGPTMSASPIRAAAGAGGNTMVHLTSVAGSGYVYLACSAASANATCAVDTANSLNPSVVDFGRAAAQTAKVTVALPNSTDSPASNSITVTAYTVSGNQSTLTIPVKMN